jgi:16S rRNA (guanine527-N7)-methyltransferase
VSSVEHRLNKLSERWSLPEGSVTKLALLLDMVQAEQSSITAVRQPKAGVDLHIADSLMGLDVPAIKTAARIADIGSGGGFPGLVLALARPEAQVTLVDSVGKKTDFLRRAADALEMDNVDVVTARAEEWPGGLGVHDVVTARALASLAVLAEYAAPLLKEGGSLVAWKGHLDPSERAAGMAAAEILGLEGLDPVRVEPFRGADARHLYVYLKVRATPSRFPRRAGMARKRPLQASS